MASVTTLANLISPERVLCNVTARSKKHCLEIIARLLTNDQDSLTESEVFDTIYQREKLGSTGLGEGFALPHGRVEDLEESVGAFLMLTEPVDFDLEGGEGVDMIFALAVPTDSAEEHLKDLSSIAQLLANTDVRGKVSHLVSSIDIHDALIELSANT
ncbi:MAG: PTS sugar transporter subunit IIA [Pseudomonadota bacterium]